MKHVIRSTRALAVATLALAAACGDAASPPAVPTPGLQGVVVSSTRGLVQPAPVAFISLEPGTVLTGSEIVVTNRVSGARASRTLVAGSFDPFPVSASAGDELQLSLVGSPARITRMAVALPPVVVRTEPTRRRPSVPLNTRLLVVFSEPVDPATIGSGAVRLVGSAGEEAITLQLTDDGSVMHVDPRATLRPGTAYRLEIGSAITDLTGDHLQQAETIDFTTESLASTTPFAIRLCPDTLRVPVGAISGYVVVVDSGARTIRSFPDPALTWSSSDSSIARPLGGGVDGVAMGQAWIRVTYRGDTDSALVIVTSWPPPAPFGIWPGGAIMPIGHTDTFEVSHPEGTPAPVVTWRVSDSRIINVAPNGSVTGLAAGTAWVIVTNGTDTDSAQVDVYDPSPKLGQLYRIRPDSVLFQTGDHLYLSLVGPQFPAPPVTWSIANQAIASIDQFGSVAAHAIGRTTLKAAFSDGSEVQTSVTVVAPGTLGHITLTPLAPTVRVGDTLRFEYQLDERATELWGGNGSSWTLAGPALTMQMNAAGSFIAVQPGKATVRAYAGPLFAETVVTVIP